MDAQAGLQANTQSVPDDPGGHYGIDLKLTATGDLAVSPSGGLVFSSGPENCVQALTMRMRTAVGELPLHPDYGSSLPALIGGKTTDDPLAASHANFDLRALIGSDPRFLAASDIAANQTDGPPTATFISCTLTLAAGDQVLLDDLVDVGVSQIVAGEDLDLPSDADPFGDDSIDFFANDDTELAELADAADLFDAVAPTAAPITGD